MIRNDFTPTVPMAGHLLATTMLLGGMALPAPADDLDNCRWSPLGSGINGVVHALEIFDDGTGPALYAGGQFTLAGDIVARNIAKWDGMAWHPVGGGTNGTVRTMHVFDDGSGPALYAGGHFTMAGGDTALRIARWDGDAWTPIGGGVSGATPGGVPIVLTMATFTVNGSSCLIVGGDFKFAGGLAAGAIAVWDGTLWSPLGLGVDTYGKVSAVTPDTSTEDGIYIAGPFTAVDGVPANKIARWNGAGWTPLGSGFYTGYSWSGICMLMPHDRSREDYLYAGGWFSQAGDVPAMRAARWDGKAWSAMGSGLSGPNTHVDAFAIFDDGYGESLIAVGGFSITPGSPRMNIAQWRNEKWTTLGGGLDGAPARCAVVFNDGSGPALYVGGEFHAAGGRPVNRIARFGPFCDCNANGLPDSDEIADGTLVDCDGNGIPDTCDLLASHISETRTPFSATSPVTLTIDEPQPAADTVSIEVVVRGDLGGLTRFATLSLDGEPVATLFATDGEACPTEPQRRTVELSSDEFNTHVGDGLAVFELVASGPVGECDFSLARIETSYATLPDCDADGIWDQCQLFEDPFLDCDLNGVFDACEDYVPSPLDCDGNGKADECEIVRDPLLDKNDDGRLDSCNYARGDFNLDDVVDGADLGLMLAIWGAVSPAIGDLSGDGLVDGADLSILLGNWGPIVFK